MSRLGRSAREQAEFERFHYPGTDTLRNTLDLTDREQLELAERYLSSLHFQCGPTVSCPTSRVLL